MAAALTVKLTNSDCSRLPLGLRIFEIAEKYFQLVKCSLACRILHSTTCRMVSLMFAEA